MYNKVRRRYSMFHISDIKKFVRCPLLYYYSQDEESVFKPYLRSDESIIDLLINYFNLTKYYLGVKNDDPKRVLNELNNYEWFVKARFADDDLRINIPFIHKVDDKYDLYFIYYGTTIKDIDTLGYNVSLTVLSKLGLVVNEIFLISLNADYVLEEELDLNQLFCITNKFKGRNIVDIAANCFTDYNQIISKIKENSLDTCKAVKNKNCRLNGLCDHYNKCFEQEEVLEDDSILSLVSSANKNKMFDKGIRTLKDVDIDLLEGNRVQYAQIMASKNGGLFIDKLALSEWIETINVRPISFVDFEWDRYLIPKYHGMKPMDVACFEFALYTLDEHGHLQHRTFVGTQDCRREFIEGLLEYMPKTGPILAYNAEGAECLRLLELANIFPEYKQELENMVSRFVDLATPFLEGLIYDVRMNGNYTLKKLVSICSEYDYKDLDIYDGMEAVYNWRNIDKGILSDQNKVIDDLKKYCSLDAYGLFLVYKWLIKLLVNS